MVHPHRELLEKISIFGALSNVALEFLLARSVTVVRREGEYFFREGDQAHSVYILEYGRVSVLKHWRGRDYQLKQLEPGACFGEMALMDMNTRSAAVHAEVPSSAIKVSLSAMLELSQQDPEQFTLFQMNLGREVSRRLREADARLFHMQMVAEAATDRDSILSALGFHSVAHH